MRNPLVFAGLLLAITARAAVPAADCVEPEPDFPIALLDKGSSIVFLHDIEVTPDPGAPTPDQAIIFQAGGPLGRIRHVEVDVSKPYCSVMTNRAPVTIHAGDVLRDELGPGDGARLGIRIFNPKDFAYGPVRGVLCTVGAELRRQGVRSLKVSQMKDVFGRFPIRVCLDPAQAVARREELRQADATRAPAQAASPAGATAPGAP
jgi:hypothetical protein